MAPSGDGQVTLADPFEAGPAQGFREGG